VTTAAPPLSVPDVSLGDHRGSWLPNGAMIRTRIMELRKRRGLMIALAVVNIGLPAVFLTIRLLLHAFAPKTYGPAGGYDTFTALVAGVMFVFGFIVAATLGASAGSSDVTEGMFRHLVVTGRSRMAIYFARIPAGLAIVIPMVAAGFTIVCAVCVFAAPTKLDYSGVTVPSGLSQSGLESWAAQHYNKVLCNFGYRETPGAVPVNPNCGGGNGRQGTIIIQKGGQTIHLSSKPADLRAAAIQVAKQDYTDYHNTFLSPPASLMVKAGLWIELEAIIGFMVGLGLASMIGQRTVAVVLMIVLEVILTPLLSNHIIPHFINVQRGVVGLAMAHLEPSALPHVFGGGGPGGGGPRLVPETTTVAVIVVVAWIVGWTALGAWRMSTRDA
jgi:hypothetical protein